MGAHRQKKIDGKFNPDVRFGCSAHKIMEFLIQMKAREIRRRLGLCPLGTWGFLPGVREEWELDALQVKVRWEPSAITASRDSDFLYGPSATVPKWDKQVWRGQLDSPLITRLLKVTKGKGTALRCAVSKQSVTPG